MRRLLLVGVVLMAIVAVGIGVVILNFQRLVDANRGRIVAGIAAGFGRPVQVERVTIGLRGGLGIRLEGLRIADDPAFGTEDFVVAQVVRVLVRPWPLLERRIEVRHVVAESPRITLVRTAQGMNVDSLGRAPAAKARAGADGSAKETGASGAAAIAVALVNVRDGVVRYVDSTGAQPVEHVLRPIELSLSDVAETTPVQVDFAATLEGKPPMTLRVTGTVGPVGTPPFAAAVPLALRIGIEGGDIEAKDVQIAGRVARDPSGRPMGTMHLQAPAIRVGTLSASAVALEAEEREGVLTAARLAAAIFGGTIEGSGHVDHRGDVPKIDLQASARGLDVGQLTTGTGAAGRLAGRLDATGSLTATAGDAALVRRSLAGSGHGEVRDGVLRGVNVPDAVLSGVPAVGELVTLVPAKIRQRYPEVFGSEDTRLERLAADVRIAGQRVHLDSAVAAAHDYAIRGAGTVTFERQVDFAATLVASERLTNDVFGMLKEARFLADATSRLAIPFRLTGTLPNLHAKPDAEFVTRTLQKALIGGGVDRLLGKPKPGEAKKGGGTKDLLRRGLDQLLGR